MERYATRLDIEARVASRMARTQIGPAGGGAARAASGAGGLRSVALRDLYTAARLLDVVVAGAAEDGTRARP